MTDALTQQRTTRSTCCYCGVGCGVIIHSEHGPQGARITGVEGDPEHPANFGRLCSKGRTLADSAQSLEGRALRPEIRARRQEARQAVDWSLALDTVAQRLADIIERHGPDAVAFYVSGQLLTEDYYVFNKLAKGLLGTNNIDTNSRLCMSSAVTGYKLALGADGPPTCYEDLELAQTVLFAGSNAAYAHPVLFRRLEAAKAANPAIKWIVIDPRRTDTAAMADLHLAIAPGTDVALFNGMLHHMIWEGWVDEAYIAAHTTGFAELKRMLRDYTPQIAADLCGIDVADLITAAQWFAQSPASLSLYCMGLNQSSQGTDKNLSLIHLHLASRQIGKPGAGPFSLTGQPNAMGGREVGGLATMLAAHRDIQNPQHRAEVEQLWGLPAGHLSDRPGLAAVDLFEGLRTGKVKAVWIACTNPAHSMPNLPKVREALQRAEFVVVQDAFTGTDTVAYADALLPAASWGEKEGCVTNSERRISRVRAAVPAPGEAKPDWWIVREVALRLSARLGNPGDTNLFTADHPAAIYDEHRRLTIGQDLDIGGLDYATLETQGPQQWPFPTDAQTGAARRYESGTFATPDGRARFHLTPYQPVFEPVSTQYPLSLLTGRLRDQWHGMSRTGRVPALFAHSPEPHVCMHPDDIANQQLKVDTLVRIRSARGELVLPLTASDDVKAGTVFAAMHWNGQFLSSHGINEVSQPATDARSKQPELKHAAVRIEPAQLSWHLLACRRGDALAMRAALQPLLQACGYAALSLHAQREAGGKGDWVIIRAASSIPMPASWMNELIRVLELHDHQQATRYTDQAQGVVKQVHWHTHEDATFIDGLLWAGSERNGEALLNAALGQQAWHGSRLSALSRQTEAKRDPIVCVCRQVSTSAIEHALTTGADLPTLQQRLGCGTVCGSCVPQLKQMVLHHASTTPA